MSSNLPLLFNNTQIDGVNGNLITIDGAGTHRIFFVSGLPSVPTSGEPDPDGAQPISVGLNHLSLQNGKAQGGFGGGGGLGAGGALFVNKAAHVTLSDVAFVGNAAEGGDAQSGGGGGGGGNARMSIGSGSTGFAGDTGGFGGGGGSGSPGGTTSGGYGDGTIGGIGGIGGFGAGGGGGGGECQDPGHVGAAGGSGSSGGTGAGAGASGSDSSDCPINFPGFPSFPAGAAAGSGLFVMSGATTTFDIAGIYQMLDPIADDSPASLPSGGSYTPGTAAGASISKQGVGKLILAATNTYAGGTTITAGTVQIDGSIIGATSVNDGGTLAGIGSAGAITLYSNGEIAPGDSAGALSSKSLTWNGGGSFGFQLGSSDVNSDLLALTGALTKGSSSDFTFHFSDGNGAPVLNHTCTLITFTSQSGFSLSDFNYDYSGSKSSVTGTFILNPTSLQFKVTTDPVTLQSFSVQ